MKTQHKTEQRVFIRSLQPMLFPKQSFLQLHACCLPPDDLILPSSSVTRFPAVAALHYTAASVGGAEGKGGGGGCQAGLRGARWG